MNGGYARPESGGYRSREEERQYAIAMASIASKAPKRPMTNGQGSGDQMRQMQNQRDQQQPYSPEELIEAQSSLRLLKAKMSQRRDSLSSNNQESTGQDTAIRSGTSNGRTKISSKHDIQEFPKDVEDQQVGGGGGGGSSSSNSRQGQNKAIAEGKKPPLSQAAPTKVVIDLDNRPLNPALKYQRPGSSKESTAAAVPDAYNQQKAINQPLGERPLKPASKYSQGVTSPSVANEQGSRSANTGSSSSRQSLVAQPEVAKKKSSATQGTEITQNRGNMSHENEDLNAPPRQKQVQNNKKESEVPVNDDDRPIRPATSTNIYLDAAGGAEVEGVYQAQYSAQRYHDPSQQQKSAGGYAQQQQLKKKQGTARGSVQNYTDSTATPDEASSSSASGSYGASRQNTNYRKTFVPPPAQDDDEEENYNDKYQQSKRGQTQPGKENYEKKVQQQQQRGAPPPPPPPSAAAKSAQNSRGTNNKTPPPAQQQQQQQQQISQSNNSADPDNRLAVAKLSSSSQAPLPVKEHEYVQTFQCPEGCGRRFNEQALDKHVNVCKKVFQSKRAAFDSQQHRQVEDQAGGAQIPPSNYKPQNNNKKKGQQKNVARPGTSGVPQSNNAQQKAQPIKQQKVTEETPLPGSKKAVWKQQSESLRAVMRQNRGVQLSAQEQKAFDNAAYESEDLVVCPVCARKFNDKAAQKHIPFCKERSKVEQLRKGTSTSQGANNKRGMERASNSSYGKKF